MVSSHVKDERRAFEEARIFWGCGSNVGISRNKEGGITVFSIGKTDRNKLAACVSKEGAEVSKV